MESILVTYQSKTGFTKKYVEWIAESLNCQVTPFNLMDNVDMSQFKIIVYGAGIYAGRIKGLQDFKRKINGMPDKHIIVFATGGAPFTEQVMASIKTNNFSSEELNDVSLFYFQSGLNYEKMGLGEKAMLKMYNQMLKMKPNKSVMEYETGRTITNSYDNCNKERLRPLINHILEHQSNKIDWKV